MKVNSIKTYPTSGSLSKYYKTNQDTSSFEQNNKFISFGTEPPKVPKTTGEKILDVLEEIFRSAPKTEDELEAERLKNIEDQEAFERGL